MTREQLLNFNIVHFLREVDHDWQGKSKYIIERLHKLGIKVVFDIDDYWKVDKTHYLNKRYRENNIAKQVGEIFGMVDLVTTTTEFMRDKIYNESAALNVHVLTNSINPEEPQFEVRQIDNALVRFGWIGGVHHKPDLELMRYSLQKIQSDKELINKFQICLGGFNVTVQFSDQDEKDLAKLGFDVERLQSCNFKQMCDYFAEKKVNPPVPEYVNLERIFTDDHKIFKHDKFYLNYLKQFTSSMEHISFDKSYRRLWGKDVFNYAQMYNEIDVALIPLVDNSFNNCKSQLKIIEAGFMGKAVIVSNVHPYTIDCVNRENCLTVNSRMNLMDWYLHMKRMVNEPNLRADLAAAMFETVREKYHVKTPNAIRSDLYKKIIDKG